MDVLCQCCTVKVPAPPGQTVIDCKVHLEVIPGYAYQHSFPSHFPRYNEPAPPRRTEISINQRGTMGAWMCQSEDECSAEAYCSRITVCAHTQIWVLCRRTQYNEHSPLRLPCKNSNCHMWCFPFQRVIPLGITFDDHDKCGADLQMLMKYMSRFFFFFFFFWAQFCILNLKF